MNSLCSGVQKKKSSLVYVKNGEWSLHSHLKMRLFRKKQPHTFSYFFWDFGIIATGVQLLKKPTTFTPSLPSPSEGEGLPRRVMKTTPQGEGGGSPEMEHCRQAIESFQTRFEEAMDDDFNTAQALGYFYDLQTHLNTLLSLSKGQPTEEIASLLQKGLEHLSTKGWVFGLFRDDPEKYLARQRIEGVKKLNLTEEEILRSIEERNLARKEKNYKRADEVRNNLLSKGIILEDTPTGTNWKLK